MQSSYFAIKKLKMKSERYSRQLLLPEIGIQGQQKLTDAKVLVVGCGGLGCPILLYLTAAGVGTIGLMDDDLVTLSNLQRQVLYQQADIGKPKVSIAEERLMALNNEVSFRVYQERLTPQNAISIFSQYDIIVDATDNFATRYLINDACVLIHKPFVSGAISKFEGQVSVFNYNNGPTYRDLFPTPPPPELAPNCSIQGIMGVVTGIVGSLQANEVIKLITEIGEVLGGKLLLLDLLSNQQRVIAISKIESAMPITKLIDYENFCGISENSNNSENIKNINKFECLELSNMNEIQVIDVREADEYARFNIGADNIPLSEIEDRLTEIKTDRPVVVVCQSGVRSKRAVQLLQEKFGLTNLYNLTGGLKEFE